MLVIRRCLLRLFCLFVDCVCLKQTVKENRRYTKRQRAGDIGEERRKRRDRAADAFISLRFRSREPNAIWKKRRQIRVSDCCSDFSMFRGEITSSDLKHQKLWMSQVQVWGKFDQSSLGGRTKLYLYSTLKYWVSSYSVMLYFPSEICVCQALYHQPQRYRTIHCLCT